MHITVALLLVASLVAVGRASSVQADTTVWVSNGPYGGLVRALAIDPSTPSTLDAGTWGGGVFKSTDGGASWSAFGLANRSVRALAINPADPGVVDSRSATGDEPTAGAAARPPGHGRGSGPEVVDRDLEPGE